MLGVKASYGSDANDIPMREPFKWNAVASPPMSNYHAIHATAFANSYSRNNDGRSVQEQQGVSTSVLETYRTLIATRKAHVALRRGSYNPVTASSSAVYSFLRHVPEQESLLVAIRLSGTQATSTLNLSSFNLPGGSSTVQDVITGQLLTNITTSNQSAYSITLPGYGYRILAVNLTPIRPPPGPYDGVNIPGDLGQQSLVATQDNATGLGDNISELNQLYAHPVTAGLRVGITGDLATDGTGVALLLDTTSGGQIVLNFSASAPPPAGPNVLTGLRLDAGFAPDHMLWINTNGGTIYVDQFALPTASPATKVYRGRGVVNNGAGTLTAGTNPNGMMVAMDNTNTFGVTDADASGAATAATGFEMFLPDADIGIPAAPPRAPIRIAAAIVRSTGEVSNQWLPGVGGGEASRPNLGLTPDMTAVPGDQFASVTIDLPGDLDSDGDVDADDFHLFDACLSGPGRSHDGSILCRRVDVDLDLDVDQDDFGVFQRCLAGAGILSDPGCAN
jgi:hypothetical protein